MPKSARPRRSRRSQLCRVHRHDAICPIGRHDLFGGRSCHALGHLTRSTNLLAHQIPSLQPRPTTSKRDEVGQAR
jgi:hypothetical protein